MVKDRVIACIAEMAGFKPDKVNPDDNLTGKLGMDSFDLIEVVMVIEEEFEIEISDAQVEACHTVADVVALVERLTS